MWIEKSGNKETRLPNITDMLAKVFRTSDKGKSPMLVQEITKHGLASTSLTGTILNAGLQPGKAAAGGLPTLLEEDQMMEENIPQNEETVSIESEDPIITHNQFDMLLLDAEDHEEGEILSDIQK